MQAVSKGRRRAGIAASTLAVLFMVFDGVSKLLKPPPVVAACARLGMPVELCVTVGTVLLVCTALYVIPRTAVLGRSCGPGTWEACSATPCSRSTSGCWCGPGCCCGTTAPGA